MKYIPTVGLEIHTQLATDTKMFCGCSTSFGVKPNSNVCPICLGMPGVLPVLNKKAVELSIRMGLLTGGEIQNLSYFERKNYFYPDLPKGYQVSMLEFPLIKGGGVEVETSHGKKFIRLNRIHMEEDAGKLVHSEGSASYVDLNRSVVPLVEIVTEPDLDNTEEVFAFLNKLKEILIFAGISRGNMEQGNIRVDTNISIRPEGTSKLGTRTEIKNMNSFTNVVSAVKCEIQRQISIVESGRRIVQETLLYDSLKDMVSPMRSKEEAHDYRYFPEPDLVPLRVGKEMIEEVRRNIPELRENIRARFQTDYGLSDYDADILTCSPSIGAYYDNVVKSGADPKKASNWVMREVLCYINETQTDIEDFRVKPGMLATLIGMIDKGVISGSMAKTVFEEMISTGREPSTIVEEKGLGQISDISELEKIAREVIEKNPGEVEKYRAGKTQLLGFLVGQVMKATGGKANPQEVNRIMKELLS